RDVALLRDQAEKRDLAARGRRLHEAAPREHGVAADQRVAVDQAAIRVGVEQPGLPPQKLGVPQVVGVEQGEIASTGGTDAGVACGAGAAVGLRTVTDAIAIRLKYSLELRRI